MFCLGFNFVQTLSKINTKAEAIKEKIDKTANIAEADIDTYLREKADSEMEIVLNELQNSRFRDRSIQGISKTTKIHQNNVALIIRAFAKAGIVQPVQWYGKKFYRLTPKGKEVQLIR